MAWVLGPLRVALGPGGRPGFAALPGSVAQCSLFLTNRPSPRTARGGLGEEAERDGKQEAAGDGHPVRQRDPGGSGRAALAFWGWSVVEPKTGKADTTRVWPASRGGLGVLRLWGDPRAFRMALLRCENPPLSPAAEFQIWP